MTQKLCSMLLLCIFLISVFGSEAQVAHASQQVKPLAIGDIVPDMEISVFINNTAVDRNISAYKGELLILDFWATWCSPCIAMFPESDSLNKVFKDRAVILPVTYESRQEVDKLFSRSKRLKGISMPMVVGDKELQKLFPHAQLPHYVWIDKNGIVTAITGHKEVTAAHIQSVLTGDPKIKSSMELKSDEPYLEYNRDLPLLLQPLKIKAKDIRFQSLLTGYVSGMACRTEVIGDAASITRITMTNTWLQAMFSFAWSADRNYFNNPRIILEVADKSKLISDLEGQQFGEWLKENGYSYELIVSDNQATHAREIMREELKKLFPQYQVTTEMRTVNAISLVRTSKVNKLLSKGATPQTIQEGESIAMTNVPLYALIGRLNFYLQHHNKPVIDETGFTDAVDMKLHANISNLAELKTALQAYDLDLLEKPSQVEMLVIREVH